LWLSPFTPKPQNPKTPKPLIIEILSLKLFHPVFDASSEGSWISLYMET